MKEKEKKLGEGAAARRAPWTPGASWRHGRTVGGQRHFTKKLEKVEVEKE